MNIQKVTGQEEMNADNPCLPVKFWFSFAARANFKVSATWLCHTESSVYDRYKQVTAKP